MIPIDPEGLQRSHRKTAEARAAQEAADNQLFEEIITNFLHKKDNVTTAGENSTEVWWMGDLGYINSGEITDSRPVNWEVMNSLMQWCFNNGFTPELIRKAHKDAARVSHVSYYLRASWIKSNSK